MRVLRWGLVGVGGLLFVLLVAVRPGLGQTVPNFEDVPEGHFAEDAIRWAAEEGITVGVGNNLFGIGQTLKRYEMVTFLCRAFSGTDCRSGARGSDTFVDVPVDHWANYPIGWAVQGEITSGVSTTEFGGSQTLTREQIAAFLYRAKGSPPGGPFGSDIFTDVPADRSHWANQPIGWAYDQGISGGVASGMFGFGTFLAREEMVLFLCRTLAPQRCPPSQEPFEPAPDGTTVPEDRQVEGFTAVSTGASFSCGLGSDGSVSCWGVNSSGQADAPDGEFAAVRAGGLHSCGLLADRTVACWGDNRFGQADAPDGQFTAVSTGFWYSCGLRADGSITCWGNNSSGQAEAPDGQFTAVSSSLGHSCGLRADGSVTCWGSNSFGETDAPDGQFTSVSAGAGHSCGLRADGSVTCWGSNAYGSADVPPGRFTSVSAGWEFACGLRPDGSLTCWGRNEDQAGNSTGYTDAPSGQFAAVSTGSEHSCGLRADGLITCWGNNSSGETNAPDRPYPALDARAPEDASLLVEIESSASQNVTAAFDIEVEFGRSVTGLEASDIKVVNGKTTSLTGSGAVFQVTIVPAAPGAVVVWITEGATQDRFNNRNRSSELLIRRFGSDDYGNRPGFDTWNRDEVVAGYWGEFDREEPDPEFTGNVSECDPGATNQEYRDSVVQRVNWYRQMAGLDTVTERREYSTRAQHAALMMSVQRALSHNPSDNWACYTTTGALSAGQSNLSLGHSGIEAISGQMQDSGDNNLAVGHRRWILYPQLRETGTGDIPIPFDYFDSPWMANALHVHDNVWGARPAVREPRGFVAWPPSGYVPAETVWGRWSFSLSGANFRVATVTVADEHGPVPVEVLVRSVRSGGQAPEPAIVWAVYGRSDSSQFPEPTDGDSCYTVTISNVIVAGSVQTPYEYATCLLDLMTDSSSGEYFGLEWSTDSSRIAYNSGKTIWTVGKNGDHQRLITLSGFYPKWSPGDTEVVFSRNEVWKMNSDGTNQQQLTTEGLGPVWSPDGTHIVYTPPGRGIWRMDTDGANQQELTAAGRDPVWSPDGTRIAYTASGIWIVNADGSDPQELTTRGSEPAWSPDGTRIAYTASGIWIVNADGSDPRQLTTWWGSEPAWSPDSNAIVYVRQGFFNTHMGIWIVNADGSDSRQLTTTDGSHPTWSPDGTKIAYTTDDGIWTMNTDGTDQQRVTE